VSLQSANAFKSKDYFTLMVLLCVSSSRLTTSLVKLHLNMARQSPTRPTRRGIHSKNTRRTLLCVSYHLDWLRRTDRIANHSPVKCAEPRTLAREQAERGQSRECEDVHREFSFLRTLPHSPWSCSDLPPSKVDEWHTDSSALYRQQNLQMGLRRLRKKTPSMKSPMTN